MRTAIADPQLIVRIGIQALLAREADIDLVGEAEGGRQAVDLVGRTPVDVLLAHVDMGDMDGFRLARAVHTATAGRTRVLLRGSADPAVVAADALDAGALGVIGQDCDLDVVATAVRTAHRGDVFFESSVVRRFVAAQALPHRPAPGDLLDRASLTDREREVLLLVGRGWENRVIARRLRVSEGTVKTHVNRVMTKLRLPSRALLVALCYESGLIRPGGEFHEGLHGLVAHRSCP